MQVLTRQLVISLRLHFRNRMALLYGYLFPTMFLIAFWTLYRFDQIPLIRHVGELLTITVLGGACFGLPTTMVGERERGVWRRYRLAPVSTSSLVTSTVVARYVLLVLAGVLQIVLAMGLGMPLPSRPLELFVAFTCVAFAFIGVGLVIAMLADNVPAVQALGQCVFLPMLIVGGVAVPLQSLPAWAERVSAFLPGRYAVDVMQVSANGGGLRVAVFSIVALIGIGAAGCLAGAKLFRWDQEQRFRTTPGKGWVAVALAAWIAVGVAAELRKPDAAGPAGTPDSRAASEATPMPPAPEPIAPPEVATGADEAAPPTAPPTARGTDRAPAPAAASTPERTPSVTRIDPQPAAETTAPPAPNGPLVSNAPAAWQEVTRADIDRDLVFDRLPPDGGVVTPVAAFGQYPDQDIADQIASVADQLLTWLPGHVVDPVQRTRNLLFVAAVIDVAQQPMEPYLPDVVFAEIKDRMPQAELIKVLYWIAIHPERGTIPAVGDFVALGLRQVPDNEDELRNRAAIYGVKLLGRLTGHIR